MQPVIRSTITFLFVFLLACAAKDDGAKQRLAAARRLYAGKDYTAAKQEIDSLKILYPKSFVQIRAGLALLDTIRRAENEQVITECDSLIATYGPDLTKLKSLFTLRRDKEYQESGSYILKENPVGDIITGTTLRTGVGEDGVLYIESVFVGAKQKHTQIRVSAKDGSFARSLAVDDDGLNYRFANRGKDYEVIRFAGKDENGVARFIFTNEDKPLTVTLEGNYSYTLSQAIKSAVSESFRLSTMMLQLDSLKAAKEKAAYRIYYLDNKKGKQADDTLSNEP
jgi:hypothetical protein